MRVTVNGVERQVPDRSTVDTLVALITGSNAGRGIAVALNDQVVPRTQWSDTVLRDGDVVEALTAVPGG